ncbi:MAG: substrate-binding domain-containing protein [Alphaproteobacteria bacterium]|nr:substrate-binding domain-containing protein [Alphaproteobacteria bacterium]
MCAVRSWLLAALAACLILPMNGARAEPVRIGGTGMALAAMNLLAATPTANGQGRFDVLVLPSLGTAGGIKALVDREIDIAVIARPLKPEEQAKGIRAQACLVTPFVLATTHPRRQQLSLASLPRIYASDRPTWPDGTVIKIIMRSPSGSENPYITSIVPGLAEAFQIAYKQRGMPVGATDQENADLAQRAAGSLAITTLLQIRSERLKLNPIAIDGVMPSRANVASGAYPLKMPVCLVTAAEPRQDVARFIDHLRSAEGRALIESLDAAFID